MTNSRTMMWAMRMPMGMCYCAARRETPRPGPDA